MFFIAKVSNSSVNKISLMRKSIALLKTKNRLKNKDVYGSTSITKSTASRKQFSESRYNKYTLSSMSREEISQLLSLQKKTTQKGQQSDGIEYNFITQPHSEYFNHSFQGKRISSSSANKNRKNSSPGKRLSSLLGMKNLFQGNKNSHHNRSLDFKMIK